MSHCWPRSHSPVGFNVVFSKPRVFPHQAFVLYVFLYFPVFYIRTFTIHAVMLTYAAQSLIEWKRGKTKSQRYVQHSPHLPPPPTGNRTTWTSIGCSRYTEHPHNLRNY